MKKILYLLLITFILSGCSVDVDSKNSETNVDQQIQLPALAISHGEIDIIEQVWDNYAKSSTLNDTPKEPDLYLLYREGLTSKNDYVRWYSAYKIIEYSWDENHKAEIIDLLSDLTKDEKDYVKQAATFSLSVVKRDFNNNIFKKSPDGNNLIFSRFYEARYNGGEIWIYNKAIDSYWLYKKNEAGNFDSVAWAPNNRKVCVSYSGRIWTDVGILDIDINSNEHNFIYPEISSYILKNKETLGYKIGQNQRPDFNIRFLEWKEDSMKVLLSYNFTDDDFVEQSGIAVYNVEKCKVERLEKFKPVNAERPIINKPKGFKW